MDIYSIGQAAKITGLTVKTIRFYEEEGVLSAIDRRDNGYRSYSQEVIEELKLLKYARDLGLPLTEIKKLMKGCENHDCRHSEDYIKKTVDNYLVLLNQKIAQMTLLQDKLKLLRSSLPNGDNCQADKYCCDILHQLVNFTKRKGGEQNGRMLRKR